MPIDPFAVLNAMIRAEAARADTPSERRRPDKNDRDAENDRDAGSGAPDERRSEPDGTRARPTRA